MKAHIIAEELIKRFEINYGLNREQAIESAKIVADGKFLEYLLLCSEEDSDDIDSKTSRECIIWENVVEIYNRQY